MSLQWPGIRTYSNCKDTLFKDSLYVRTEELGTNHCILTALSLLTTIQCTGIFLGNKSSRDKETLLYLPFSISKEAQYK